MTLEHNPENPYDLPDPEDLIAQAIGADLDSTVFQLDESEIEWAPSIVHWITDPRFLRTESPPFPRQMQWMLQLFEDHCPDCSDHEWLKDVPADCGFDNLLDRIQPLEFGVCPKCHKNRGEFVAEKKFHYPNELNVCAGMRSGKTAASGLIATYQLHRFLQLPSPARAFGLLTAKQTLHATFTATTAWQAKDTLWQAFKDLYDGSVWYQNYINFLEEQGEKHGIPMYKSGETFIWFGKRILLHYMGADIRTIRGRTRFMGGIDEIGYFDDNTAKVRVNADGTYEALVKSLRTVRSAADAQRRQGNFNIPDGIMLNISSPSSVRDKIMRLLEESVGDPRRVHDHVASWECNPYIDRKDLISEERANPQAFWCHYGAVPPMASNPFIDNEQGVLRLVDRKATPLFSIQHTTKQDEMGPGYYVTGNLMDLYTDKLTPRLLALDAGETYCSFAGAVMRYDNANDEDLHICEAAFEIIPVLDDTLEVVCPVHFPTVYKDIIIPLVNHLNLRHVLFDRWQSTHMVQDLRVGADDRNPVEAEVYSLKWNDFTSFRARIIQGGFRFPEPEKFKVKVPKKKRKEIEKDKVLPFDDLSNLLKDLPLNDVRTVQKMPIAHMLRQIITVREVGKKVIKPVGDQDDIFRCIALGSCFIDKFRKDYTWSGDLPSAHRTKRVLGKVSRIHRGGMGFGTPSPKRPLNPRSANCRIKYRKR